MFTEMSCPRVHCRRTIEVETDVGMNKATIGLIVVAICFMGDPGLQYTAWLGDLKPDLVAAAISLLSMPWIAS
jgi:hypothetical protein